METQGGTVQVFARAKICRDPCKRGSVYKLEQFLLSLCDLHLAIDDILSSTVKVKEKGFL